VHGVIAGHQGVLILTTKPKEGTTFELLFPLDENHLASGQTPKNDMAASIAKTHHWEDLIVMVVDDQDEVREVIMTMLERMGIMAVDTDNGEDALAAIKESPGAYDLVLTDYNMPKMTGAELAANVGEVEPDLPFLLISGYSARKLTDILDKNPNIYDVLRKPVASKDLQSKISAILDRAKAA
jgi:CheY-like chemotaxis protein